MINLSLEWNVATIGELCSNVSSGGTPKSTNEKYYGGDIPWLNTKEINFNRIYDTEKHITKEGYENSAAKWVKKDSVIVAMYGATAAKVAMNMVDLTTNQACCNLTIDKSLANPKFVYYYLYSNYERLLNLASGAAQQNLNSNIIKEFPINIPSLNVQNEIVNLLSTIDDKIELNQKINQNLENIASNIFKRYFLDYAPFQNLTFNESIIGDVPNEWNFIKIKDIVDVRDGTHDSPSAVEVGFPLITSKHLNKYDVNKKEANKISFEDYTNINKRSLVEPFDILISMIGTVGNICYIMYDEIDFAIKNVGLFKTSKNPLLREYLLLYLKSNIVTQYIDSHLAGSTQKYISLTELRNIPIVIPPNEILTDFKDIINPIFNNIKINNLEINTLINLRDILLPKLMSGEIDVSKINLNYNKD